MKNVIALSVLALVVTVRVAQADDVAVVPAVPAEQSTGIYVSNRAPLATSPLIKLPIGAIESHGWLHHQLQLEASGMGGQLEQISPFLKYEGNGWVDANGKTGWEELPYWLRGYGDLGYVLGDEKIIADAKHWINGILANQQPDGWFGPLGLKKALDGRPDMWPHMPILNALQSYYEFTGDQRVLTFMTNYFKWQNTLPPDYFSKSWQDTRFGDNIESIYWLYNRTGDAWLLELPPKIHANSAKWWRGIASWHNVNLAQGFREPAEFWMQQKDPALLADTERNYQTAMGTYGQFPGGGFAADENARPGYHDPRQGFETCGIVEFMHSFEMLAKITGNPIWLDRCEYIAFNSLPAALTPDLKGLHYVTNANAVQLDQNNKAPGVDDSGTLFSYSPYQVYRCCQHNHTMGWPYYAEHLWMATADGGLCPAIYNASNVTAKVAGGATIKIAEETDYPFSDSIQFKITSEKPAVFPLYLRIPGWCQSPGVKVNGQDVAINGKPAGQLVSINRTWRDGDTVALTLPMTVDVKRWEKNQDSASVNYGPLTFSLLIGEKWVKYGGSDQWPEQAVYPTTPWNYGLVLDESAPANSFELVKKPGPVADQPFDLDTAPLELHAKGRRIDRWTLNNDQLLRPLQASPVKSDWPEESITLIPMGAARLRISSFPVIGQGADAHEWQDPTSLAGPAGTATPTASYCFSGDNVNAINSGQLPDSSGGGARMTWWDHKGTSEWVQYDFKSPIEVDGSSVYWFDDSTRAGGCRVPQSWHLLYRDGDAWKPVEAPSGYGVQRDAFNAVTFTPVKTTALRIAVQLQPNFSGGVLQWKVDGSTDTSETTGGWIKYPNNPVMGGKYGTCFDVSVLREQGVYRMWLSWRPQKSLALVESVDGIHWSEPPRIVFGPRSETGWENDINRPIVIKHDGIYQMWYTGQANGHSSIGYATSPDGITWKRMSDKPVLSPEKPWENVAVMCPDVIWDEAAKTYRMWYSGGEQEEPNNIGYATSPDGLTWTKRGDNPIFTGDPKSDWEKQRVTACQVIPQRDGYLMFYIGFSDILHAQIGMAWSKDGITNWQRYGQNPIIRTSDGNWDQHACYKPFALFDGQKWLLWYNGRRNSLEQIGVVFHEGEDLGFPAASH